MLNDTALEPLSAAKHLIARAVIDGDADSLTELRRRASAFELYHQRAGARIFANDAGEIKVRAERGLGQIDAAENPHGGDRYQASAGEAWSPSVASATRAAWRKLGTLTEETLADYIARLRADENAAISTAALIGILRLGGALSSTTFECYTPAEYVEAARTVLGEIDLDPASSAEANETVRAHRYFDADMDGLAQSWSGRVWLNPPYGRSLTGSFVGKCVAEYEAGNVSAAVILLNAYGFDADWFQPLWGHTLCFTDHRIKFYGGSPTFGSLFVYIGSKRDLFISTFARYGALVERAR